MYPEKVTIKENQHRNKKHKWRQIKAHEEKNAILTPAAETKTKLQGI